MVCINKVEKKESTTRMMWHKEIVQHASRLRLRLLSGSWATLRMSYILII